MKKDNLKLMKRLDIGLISTISLLYFWMFMIREDGHLLLELILIVVISMVFFSLSWTHKQKEKIEIESGKLKFAIRGYRIVEFMDAIKLVSGFSLILFETFDYWNQNTFSSVSLRLGSMLIIDFFNGISQYFIRIENDKLKIKGHVINLNDISTIKFELNEIVIDIQNRIIHIGIDKLSKSEKEEAKKTLSDFYIDK